MGIKGLFKFINEYKDQVCCPQEPLRGKLLVEGYSTLHEIYTSSSLEWSTGGCYNDQHEATLLFYDTLIKAGVEPVVVLDGADSKDDIEDTIYRRKEEIAEISSEIRNRYDHFESRDYRNHYFPVLARQAYKASLNTMDGVEVIMADKKAYQIIVQLAHHYGCPVLTNNTNYCVPALPGGVALFEHFDRATCSAPVYMQSKLVDFLHLRNPDLLCAIAAILGENNRLSTRFMYHGSVKGSIEKCAVPQPLPKDRPFVMNIADYLRRHRFKSFQDFEDQVMELRFGMKKDRNEQLAENCRIVRETFVDKISQHKGPPEFTTLAEKKFPQEVISQYRQGNYPEIVVTAVCEGKCILDVFVGDRDQPPVLRIGEPIRQIMYGLVMNKMETRAFRRTVEEYYRSDKPNSEGQWEYTAHNVKPTIRKFKDLSIDNILALDEKKRKEEGKAAICEVLQLPLHILQEFDNESPYLLIWLTIQYWASHLQSQRQLDSPVKLVKALIVNLLSPSSCDKELEQDLYYKPMWIKVYHAFLEWQVLYRDARCLNCMLFCPFVEPPTMNILNGSAVMKLALNPDPDVFTTLRDQMDRDKMIMYDRIIAKLGL